MVMNNEDTLRTHLIDDTSLEQEVKNKQNVLNDLNNTLESHTLELLAERPQVQIDKVTVGNIRLSKEIKTQTINVPVTLTQQVLIIEHIANNHTINSDKELITIRDDSANHPSTILLNGEPLVLTDQPYEILLSQQVAKVAIETLVAEKVALTTSEVQHEQQIPVTLRHEELITEQVKLDNPSVTATRILNEDDINLR